jgi:LacI family transcriptional regulator
MKVPTELSVVGFDDIPMAASHVPPLTTVRQPLEDIGQSATKMLLNLIQNPDEDQASIVLPTELILRGTTASPSL